MPANKTKEISEHDSALRYGELMDEVRAYRAAMIDRRRIMPANIATEPTAAPDDEDR